jgi:hypothetical protein
MGVWARIAELYATLAGHSPSRVTELPVELARAGGR